MVANHLPWAETLAPRRAPKARDPHPVPVLGSFKLDGKCSCSTSKLSVVLRRFHVAVVNTTGFEDGFGDVTRRFWIKCLSFGFQFDAVFGLRKRSRRQPFYGPSWCVGLGLK